MKCLCRLLSLTFLLWSSAVSFGSDPNGTWSSSTGSTIQLWANTEQVNVTVTSPQGVTNTYRGPTGRGSAIISPTNPLMG